jgi:hypothetical protein
MGGGTFTGLEWAPSARTYNTSVSQPAPEAVEIVRSLPHNVEGRLSVPTSFRPDLGVLSLTFWSNSRPPGGLEPFGIFYREGVRRKAQEAEDAGLCS